MEFPVCKEVIACRSSMGSTKNQEHSQQNFQEQIQIGYGIIMPSFLNLEHLRSVTHFCRISMSENFYENFYKISMSRNFLHS